mmetsp:Transcript_6655/g.13783  ORF Transcript_6655/g.13783 Transcript_6655/m.13783 type:complete len:380 (+) Transcript_6655:677-1816(+)
MPITLHEPVGHDQENVLRMCLHVEQLFDDRDALLDELHLFEVGRTLGPVLRAELLELFLKLAESRRRERFHLLEEHFQHLAGVLGILSTLVALDELGGGRTAEPPRQQTPREVANAHLRLIEEEAMVIGEVVQHVAALDLLGGHYGLCRPSGDVLAEVLHWIALLDAELIHVLFQKIRQLEKVRSSHGYRLFRPVEVTEIRVHHDLRLQVIDDIALRLQVLQQLGLHVLGSRPQDFLLRVQCARYHLLEEVGDDAQIGDEQRVALHHLRALPQKALLAGKLGRVLEHRLPDALEDEAQQWLHLPQLQRDGPIRRPHWELPVVQRRPAVVEQLSNVRRKLHRCDRLAEVLDQEIPESVHALCEERLQSLLVPRVLLFFIA